MIDFEGLERRHQEVTRRATRTTMTTTTMTTTDD